MKKKKRQSLIVIIVLLCLSLLVYFLFPKPPVSLSSFDKRAVWLSYQELSTLSYDSQESFQEDFQDILNTIKNYKNNTIIVQVRTFSDALYSSKLYPLSQVITHHQTLTFDPLEEMIQLSHQNDISIEAWINPYRISLNEKTYNQFLTSKKRSWLNDSNQTIHYGTYQYIFNPASQKVRDYIVEGVEEIITQYDIDGIHFDDYFYVPGTHDQTTQNERLDNVNMLIQDVYHCIKSYDNDISFGISPQGNYENCINEGADIDTWLKEEGYIDYLMPQIYWSDYYGKDGNVTMFSDRAKKFSKIERNSHVQLYAGLALYQAGQSLESDQGWSMSSHNLSDQVQILSQLGYDGYSLFRYEYLLKVDGKKEMDELLKDHP